MISANIPSRAYNFRIKIIPNDLKISTRKNKRCYVNLPIPYNRPSLSRGYRQVTIINHCCNCFDGIWKVKVKFIVFCLNAFAKLQIAKRGSRHPILMGSWPSCSHMPCTCQSSEWLVISPFQVVCRA